MPPKNIGPFDINTGIELSRPLVRVILEALYKLTSQDSPKSVKTLLDIALESDETSLKLFESLNLNHHCDESSLRYCIRCGLVVLDSSAGHNLIFMLTGIDVRAIVITASIITKIFSKVILKLDNLNQIELNLVATIIYEELTYIKDYITSL